MTYSATILADSPVAYWRLGETSGTNANDEIGTADGTYNGSFTLNQTGALSGDSDKAVALTDNAGTYIGVPDSAPLDVADVFTLEAWIKRYSITNDIRRIIWKGAGAPSLVINANNTFALDKWGTDLVVSSTVAITDTSWHHLVVTKSGSTVHLYLDGSDVTGTVNNLTFIDNATALSIGAESTGTNQMFRGTVDEVAIYHTALTSTQVAAHYAAGTGGTTVNGSLTANAYIKNTLSSSFTADAYVKKTLSSSFTANAQIGSAGTQTRTGSFSADAYVAAGVTTYVSAVLADSPVAYWRLGETGGTNANDETANNLDGTYTGGYTLSQTGALSGDSNKAVLLDGSTGYIPVADANPLDLGDGPFSLEAWIKSSSVGTDKAIFSKGTGAYGLEIGDDGAVYFRMDNGGSGMARNSTSLTDGAWHHIVATKNGNAVVVYVDGTNVTVWLADATLSSNALALNIGRRTVAGSAFFNGSLDELAIYNSVLTPARVSAHYAAGIGGPAGNSFTANAYIKKTLSSSFTANANIWSSTGAQGGSFTADAYINSTVPANLANHTWTLQQACTNMGANATFGVPAYIYSETVTPLAGQHLMGYPGAIIDGGNSRAYGFVLTAAGVTIDGFEVRNHATPLQDGTIRVRATDTTILHTRSHHNAGPGISIIASNALVEDCEFDYNKGSGFHGTGSTNTTYRRCLIHHNNLQVASNPGGYTAVVAHPGWYWPVDPFWEAGAGKITNSNTILFDACEVYYNGGVGLWSDINGNNWTVQNCRVYWNDLSGIMFEIGTGATIQNNVVWHNGEYDHRGWGWPANILVSSAANATVDGNLVAFGLAGISAITQNRPDKPANSGSNIHFTNNIICEAAKADGWYDDWGGGFPGKVDTGNTVYTGPSPARDAILIAAGILPGLAYSQTVLADSPLVYYRCDASSGNTETDLGSLGRNGVYAAGYTLGQTGLLTGDPDTAVAFDGMTGTRLGIGSGTILALGDVFTIEAWLKPQNVTTLACIFSESGTGNAPWIRLNDTAKRITVGGNTTGAIAVNLTDLVAGNTYHVVWTKSGATNHIYLNGVDNTGAVTNATIVTPTGGGDAYWFVNPDGANNPYNGVGDELAIYTVALSATQVAAHHVSGPAVTPTGSIVANAFIKRTGLTWSLTANAHIAKRTAATFTANAQIGSPPYTPPSKTGRLTADAFIAAAGSVVRTATPNATDGTCVVLVTHTAPTSATSISLCRQNPLNAQWGLLAILPVNFSYTDVSCPLGLTYAYRVDEYSASGVLVVSTTLSNVLVATDDWVLASDSIGTVRCYVGDAGSQRVRQQETFSVLGEHYLDVQSGRLLGRSGSLSIDVLSTQRAALVFSLTALANSSERVYLKSPFGEVWWIAPGGPSVKYMSVGHTVVTVTFTQVGEA